MIRSNESGSRYQQNEEDYYEGSKKRMGDGTTNALAPLFYVGFGAFATIFIMMITMPKIDLSENVECPKPIIVQPKINAVRSAQVYSVIEEQVPASVEETTETVSPRETRHNFVAKYGFYIHVFKHPKAVIHQIQQIDRYFPDSPIYIMSDGGDRFDGLCQKYKCTFKYCPPANDRWHPWPFMHRMREAAIEMNTEYLIYLEPDNTIHGPINYEPDSDAGGMKDANPKFGVRITGWAEEHARLKDPNFKWGYTGSGLAGGSYFKTSVIKDAFSDEKIAEIDWALLRSFDSKRVFSSDFAMPIALSYSGYQYRPWKDIIQWDFPDQPNVTKYAFEHYSRGVEGGKPEYRNSAVEGWQSLKLYETQLKEFSDFRNCEFCWNVTEYIQRWGTTECANPIPVRKHCANPKECPQP